MFDEFDDTGIGPGVGGDVCELKSGQYVNLDDIERDLPAETSSVN